MAYGVYVWARTGSAGRVAGAVLGKRFCPYLLERDKVRLNKYYYEHYSFWKDIEMIFATVMGRKMTYAGGGDMRFEAYEI